MQLGPILCLKTFSLFLNYQTLFVISFILSPYTLPRSPEKTEYGVCWVSGWLSTHFYFYKAANCINS